MSREFYYSEKKRGILQRFFNKQFLKREPVPQIPEHIQIQTISNCNASCIFCPNLDTRTALVHGKMEMPLFEKIADECLEIGIKKVRPYLMNEPLLDRDLWKKIEYLTERKSKDVEVRINTNASLLNEEIGRGLIESKLDILHISFHGYTKEVYEKNMGNLKFEEVLKTIEDFVSLKEKLRVKKPEIKITMVKTKNIEDQIPQIKKFWEERGLKVNIRPFTNRVSDRITNLSINTKDWRTYSWCTRLFTQAYILFNGDMVLCCNDWWRTTILGNVRDSSIREIWNNKKYTEIRKQFLSGDFEGLLCKDCLRI